MEFIKATYNIRVRAKDGVELKPVHGYVFSYKGLRFGVTNRNADGKTCSAWAITELSTGMIATNICRKTRKETVEGFSQQCNDEILNKMEQLVEKFLSNNQDSNPAITFNDGKKPVAAEVHSQTFKKRHIKRLSRVA